MKSIIQSIRPEWVVKILRGEKTIEVRKRYIEPPFKVYIYCTKGKGSLVYSKDSEDVAWCKPFVDKENNRVWTVHNEFLRKNCKSREWNGKVVAEYVCDEVEKFIVGSLRCDDIQKLACLDYEQMINYYYKPHELDGKTQKTGYAYHITDLKIYDKPRELSEFYTETGTFDDNDFVVYFKLDENGQYEVPHYMKRVKKPPVDFMWCEELK